ncbi:MAG: divergent PAP2 family protein [bacterium]|nr:divergent PAP2 family protein [bacterium]
MPSILTIFVLAWGIAQGIKYLLEARKNDDARFKRIITESGGMPSAHSAVVISITTYIGFTQGIFSAIFGLAVVFSAIVIYDSMKVRYSNGIQAQRINEIIESQKMKLSKVRVVKGHTPLEVAVGMSLGFLIGYFSFILGI